MTKRGRIILGAVVLALAVLAISAWLISTSGPPDPVYSGHRLSYLVSHLTIGIWTPPPGLDSNAVPYLAQTLNTRDGPARKAYIGLYPHFPNLLKGRLDPPMSADGRKVKACLMLGSLGVIARPAIPELVRLINSNDPVTVRRIAIYSLSQIGRRNDAPVMQCLAAAGRDTNSAVRTAAAVALQRLDPSDKTFF
jgi:hypothetical protein